jgi:hypothetical protein
LRAVPWPPENPPDRGKARRPGNRHPKEAVLLLSNLIPFMRTRRQEYEEFKEE